MTERRSTCAMHTSVIRQYVPDCLPTRGERRDGSRGRFGWPWSALLRHRLRSPAQPARDLGQRQVAGHLARRSSCSLSRARSRFALEVKSCRRGHARAPPLGESTVSWLTLVPCTRATVSASSARSLCRREVVCLVVSSIRDTTPSGLRPRYLSSVSIPPSAFTRSMKVWTALASVMSMPSARSDRARSFAGPQFESSVASARRVGS